MITLIVFMAILVFYQFYAGLEAYRKLNRRSLKGLLRIFRTELTVLVILAVPLIAGNMWFASADLITPEKKIEYGTRYDQPQVTYRGYLELCQADSTNLDHAFNLVKYANEYRSRYELGRSAEKNIYGRVYKHFERLSKGGDPRLADIGHFGMGFYSLHASDLSQISTELHEVKDTSMKYLNYAFGLGHYRLGEPKAAEQRLLREIGNGGANAEAFELLSYLYWYTGQREKGREILYDDKTRKLVPRWIAKKLFFLEKDIWGYVEMIWQRNVVNFSWYGIFASVLITLIWSTFLLILNAFKRTGLMPLLLCFGLGFFFSNGVYFISDFLHLYLGLELDSSFGGDLVYCIVGIGAVEELVKMLPWLLILAFTKEIREPFDYLLFASVSALGFAFAENVFYFNNAGLDNIHARALTSVASHMFDACIVAYAVVYFRFKTKRNPWVGGSMGFALAAISHGFYDFWLIHEFEESMVLFTIVFFLVTIHFWFTMLNNTLNNSSIFNEALRFDNARLSLFLSSSLTGLFMVEYILLGGNYGIDYANGSLITEMFSGGYLVFYIASNLSNLDLVKGYWAPINFPMASFIASGRVPRNYLNYRVKVTPVTRDKPLDKYLPFEGRIIHRLIIGKNPNWFVLELTGELRFRGFQKTRVMLFFPEEHETLDSGETLVTRIYLLRDDADLSTNILNQGKMRLAGLGRSIRLVE